MFKHALILLFSSALFLGCGTTPPADGPGDVTDGDVDTPTGDTPDAPSDGIVRDADGDGVSDDKQKSDCGSKTKTECEINMACAWSGEDTCVKSKGGM